MGRVKRSPIEALAAELAAALEAGDSSSLEDCVGRGANVSAKDLARVLSMARAAYWGLAGCLRVFAQADEMRPVGQ